MPAFNESEGIGEFVTEIRVHVASLAERVTFLVADDRSTDGTAEVLAEIDDVQVQVQASNRGHGPTALAAYRAGLALTPDVLVHVDGDGQFLGQDLARVISALLRENADVVHGVRRNRTDPWFRRVLTATVSVLVAATVGRRIPDVNTPLRAYRPGVVAQLVAAVPSDSLIPHVHFALAEARGDVVVRYLAVRSIPRRGVSASGTMWGRASRIPLPSKRLRSFARAALRELWLQSLRAQAPLREISLTPAPSVR